MNNREAYDRMDQSGAIVNKLFYLPFQSESSELEEMLGDLNITDINELVGGDLTEEDLEDYRDFNELNHVLQNYGIDGFIVEVHIPKRDNFKFNEEGELSSWSVSRGICNVRYANGNTLEELVEKIGNISEEIFEKEWKQELEKN